MGEDGYRRESRQVNERREDIQVIHFATQRPGLERAAALGLAIA